MRRRSRSEIQVAIQQLHANIGRALRDSRPASDPLMSDLVYNVWWIELRYIKHEIRIEYPLLLSSDLKSRAMLEKIETKLILLKSIYPEPEWTFVGNSSAPASGSQNTFIGSSHGILQPASVPIPGNKP